MHASPHGPELQPIQVIPSLSMHVETALQSLPAFDRQLGAAIADSAGCTQTYDSLRRQLGRPRLTATHGFPKRPAGKLNRY